MRIAIGASPTAVEWMFLREALTVLAIGAGLGVPAASLVIRVASAMLYGLTPQDPASMAVARAVLGVATSVAAYVPARRAARIDPCRALRAE